MSISNLNTMDSLPVGSVESIDQAVERYFNEKDIYSLENGSLFVQKTNAKTFADPINFSTMKRSLWSALQMAGHPIKKADVEIFLLGKFPKHRTKAYVAFTDDVVSNDEVNLFNDAYLKAKVLRPLYDPSKPVHPFFDILIQCLSDGEPQFISHLEMCILRKVFYPTSDYRIPCIVWYGPGSTGKQLFAINLLPTILGVETCKADLSIFNPKGGNKKLLGAHIVYLNEVKIEDYSNIGDFIWEMNVRVRKLYRDEFLAKNFSWYIISANSESAPVPLTGGNEDRRYSVISHKRDKLDQKDIDYWIAKSDSFKNSGFKFPEKYRERFANVLSDREQVSLWLGRLLLRHGFPAPGDHIDSFKTTDYWLEIKNRRDMFDALDAIILAGEVTDFSIKELHNFLIRHELFNGSEEKLGFEILRWMTSRTTTFSTDKDNKTAEWVKYQSDTMHWKKNHVSNRIPFSIIKDGVVCPIDLDLMFERLYNYRIKKSTKPIDTFSIPVATIGPDHKNWNDEWAQVQGDHWVSVAPNISPFDIEFHDYSQERERGSIYPALDGFLMFDDDVGDLIASGFFTSDFFTPDTQFWKNP